MPQVRQVLPQVRQVPQVRQERQVAQVRERPNSHAQFALRHFSSFCNYPPRRHRDGSDSLATIDGSSRNGQETIRDPLARVVRSAVVPGEDDGRGCWGCS